MNFCSNELQSYVSQFLQFRNKSLPKLSNESKETCLLLVSSSLHNRPEKVWFSFDLFFCSLCHIFLLLCMHVNFWRGDTWIFHYWVVVSQVFFKNSWILYCQTGKLFIKSLTFLMFAFKLYQLNRENLKANFSSLLNHSLPDSLFFIIAFSIIIYSSYTLLNLPQPFPAANTTLLSVTEFSQSLSLFFLVCSIFHMYYVLF